MSNTTAPYTMSSSRLEAFSDGVIAIIITVMVFDLKIPELADGAPLSGGQWRQLVPRFISYACSFVVLAIMWVNHHQLFHLIRRTDRRLLWLNIMLLFWMSLVPFSTNFIGSYPRLPEATLAYGFVFFMNAVSFYFLRAYAAGRGNLMHENVSPERRRRANRKNILGMSLYLLAALAGYLSVYLSYLLIVIVPVMYFFPERVREGEKG